MDNPIKDVSFSVIRQHNSANKAETLDGFIVHRKEQIFFNEVNSPRLVKCSPYDNHFIYEDPSGKINRWNEMCTCGSFAVIVGYNVYKKDASPTTRAESSAPGEMFICWSHATTGRHAEGSG